MSEKTKKQYKSAYNVVQKITGKDMDYVIRHPKETYDKIKVYEYKEGKKYDTKSLKNLLTAILSYYKGADGLIPCDLQPYHLKYLKYFRELKEKVEAFYDKNQPTEKQKEGVLEWEDVVKKCKELGDKEYGSKRHLLLSMYTYIPPLRQDFNEVKIVSRAPRKNEGNYLILGENVSKLVLNEYKSAVHYGKFETDIPKELVKIIRESLKLHPRKYLFTDVEGRPYKECNSYTVYSNRILKGIFVNKSVSVSMLRHSYISGLNFNNLTEGEKKEIAQQMTHSVSQQGRYRHIDREDT